MMPILHSLHWLSIQQWVIFLVWKRSSRSSWCNVKRPSSHPSFIISWMHQAVSHQSRETAVCYWTQKLKMHAPLQTSFGASVTFPWFWHRNRSVKTYLCVKPYFTNVCLLSIRSVVMARVICDISWTYCCAIEYHRLYSVSCWVHYYDWNLTFCDKSTEICYMFLCF